LRQYRTAYDEKTKTFSDTPQRDWTTDIADAARYMAVAAREIAPPPPPKSEQPPGIPMSDMTMDQWMDIEDGPPHRDRVWAGAWRRDASGRRGPCGAGIIAASYAGKSVTA